MNKISYAALIALFYVNNLYAQTGTLTVHIEGVLNTTGMLEIGLYNTKENFPDYEKTFRNASVTPKLEGVSYTFEDIPVGNYAVATWHDENENQEVDKNLLGVPKESYGFSLNEFGIFGPPEFSKVSFKIEENKEKTLTINLK